jgi:hypothetical protein
MLVTTPSSSSLVGPYDFCQWFRAFEPKRTTRVFREGIKPPPDRIKALEKYPSPKNGKQLRRVLGLFNWFKKFIPQYRDATVIQI